MWLAREYVKPVPDVANRSIEVTPERVAATGRVEAGYVYVDGVTVGAVGEVVIRDRRALSREGIDLDSVVPLIRG